jgi:hypothetical protein
VNLSDGYIYDPFNLRVSFANPIYQIDLTSKNLLISGNKSIEEIISMQKIFNETYPKFKRVNCKKNSFIVKNGNCIECKE